MAVRLAHKMAIESDLVRADMVEAIEFPHLANKYQVMGVPRTIINETTHQEGAIPEMLLMIRVLEAVGQEIPADLLAQLRAAHRHEA